ncbi:integral peroxisomal membrane peroxin-domain-containing protein [Calycina marina]|uniref:Integral peroxisomal membrane peroxin-domain-containing protein n=1 Tax=Calycina marina TaxID=1763456 RepID=A0A9P8CCN8_9HELO|nr:integral peroxisomal membrane peroxin-domain-containing protein [Calycina marina]
MAAFDTPWLDLMSPPTPSRDETSTSNDANENAPTTASFSPITLSSSSTANKQRSTILVHQKSPLLIQTPPQITRALAYSHPFLLPLNKFVGLLTWTTGDPWESFLLVASFWGVVLYGDVIMRYAGPVVIVMGLILGMYSRRYSPLSSSGLTSAQKGKGHKRETSEITNTKHQKTLDEIVETLKVFTSRCNVLLDPLLELTDFLSTQRTATSATTRPALTTLLIRILLVTPLWILLTLKPLMIISTKRLVLVAGTIFLTWHSKPNRVTRAILWRSALVRRICSGITGLHLTDTMTPPKIGVEKADGAPPLPPRKKSTAMNEALYAATLAAKRRPDAPGVRFTFILYENQRRWVGLGWTTSLFAYERAAWTDEHLNSAPDKEEFELPDVDGGGARWRWAKDSQWLVEGAKANEEGGSEAKEGESVGGMGWIYYDNKWKEGRRGQDGWGRYTRRRKWYRDAELVEITASTQVTPLSSPVIASQIQRKISHAHRPSPTSNPSTGTTVTNNHISNSPEGTETDELKEDYATSIRSFESKSSIFKTKGGSMRRRDRSRSSTASGRDEGEDRPMTGRNDWGVGDEIRMGLE